MSLFTTTVRLHHRTLLPEGSTRSKALQVFANHDALIRLDPELVSYEEIVSQACNDGKDGHATKNYKVTDKMEALPAHIWDTTVAYTASIRNTETGVEWIVKAPMGIEQRSNWMIEPASKEDLAGEEGTERLVLVEDVDIKCSRFLIGMMKNKIEDNWRGVHARWIEAMQKIVD